MKIRLTVYGVSHCMFLCKLYFGVLTAAFLKSRVLWSYTPCRLVND